MVTSFGGANDEQKSAFGIDRVLLRLTVFGTLVVVLFVALFSRLWFLQVLDSSHFQRLAKNNRTRIVESEPPRGLIRARDGTPLVANRRSLSVTVDRQVVNTPRKARRVLKRLSKQLVIPIRELRKNLRDEAVSPYKPVAVANDVSEKAKFYIKEHSEDFPGVDVENLPVRRYPRGRMAAQILGFVGEISEDMLKSDHFRRPRTDYAAGDIVGREGVEYVYDRFIRGRPRRDRVTVNSAGDVFASKRVQKEKPGRDLYLTIDRKIQTLTEKALADGIEAAQGQYVAPAGGVVVMDPDNGEILSMASYPTYNPSILADGYSDKDARLLGARTPDEPADDRLLNRPVLGGFPPGSTFKVVTAEAALWSGVASPYTALSCPGSIVYPPEGGPGSVVFNNWTSADYGYMGLAESLEVSCDTFYYQLGINLEEAFGAAQGDGTEKFQQFMRMAGFGHETGIDLPYEADGRVPDQEWCETNSEIFCPYGWLPGYTINMAIGQGELIVTPLQMAVTYAAVGNGGRIVEPRLAKALGRTTPEGDPEILREFKSETVRRLPLDDSEWAPIRQGLELVISGDQGTAAGAFAGYPQGRFPIAGKTGTAQIGSVDSGLNYAWFASYAPVDDPEYVVVVYLEKAGHGGESAAPVARQIYEGIFGIDEKADVELSQDASG
jgi:penicillin-binding protein 2